MTIYFEKTYQRSFGTFPLKGQDLKDAILAAAEVGYRSFDTAQMYGNEAETGAALKATSLARGDLCITTKVDIANFSDEAFLPSVEESLKKLQIEQVDVLLLHWPTPGGDIRLSLQLLQQAHDRGLARHIGVSNYTAPMMRQARTIVDAPLVTNQVEFHPLLNQDKLLVAASETGIPLASYCSVARGEVFKHAIFGEIGAAYGKSAAQVVLRWILQKGVSINTMSTKPANIAANFDVMDFTLSSIDMARIEKMTNTGYRIVGKGLVPYAPDFD
ncbi:aldo/keto reductase [Antarctobacter heliothermus]|uniref:2,5-diketo-D-gluconate reductase B n=1 Tax=Antarctobacter heliothermus TaxID=74033 RepID=A0A239KT55_9RHOB|nr:aldo/keto reductase [Antarctobacter heliothermus]SNT20858.1 2,5-diketo-D-gluconate reductase B [Antarctobacter heliothermus]